jgi:hypothetical protein
VKCGGVVCSCTIASVASSADSAPHEEDEQKKGIDLLKRACVEARYNPGYKITKV